MVLFNFERNMKLIFGRVVILLGISFFLLTLVSNYKDIFLQINGHSGITQIGEIWFYFAPQSLQMAETIISRYIDPCSSLDILNCSGFIWYPFIFSILALPAAPFFALFSFFLIKIGLKKSYKKRNLTKSKIDPTTKN